MEYVNIGIALYLAAAAMFYIGLVAHAQPDPVTEEWTPIRLRFAG